MISVHEAVSQILETVSPLAGERVSLFEASGRVLAEAIPSDREVPPFDNSAMDGYAVRWQDIRQAEADTPAELSVLEVIQAGGAGIVRPRPSAVEPGRDARRRH